MPEFILDYGSPEAARNYAALDEFAQGYIEAMFFTSTDFHDELEHATVAELAPETWEKIVSDCQRFQAENAADLDAATENGQPEDYDLKAAGRDFWYTRNGHGTGYWCRNRLGPVSAKLTAACKSWSQIDLYRGGDDLIYLS